MIRPLKTAATVIEHLGGLDAVRRLTRAKSISVVSNWKVSGGFPPKTYVALTKALKARGLSAPPSLWGMLEAAE